MRESKGSIKIETVTDYSENTADFKTSEMEGELFTILNCLEEAVEVADEYGIIKYINPSFTKITGLTKNDRIGKNVFSLSPDCLLSEVLRHGQAITGFRTFLASTCVEIIANAAPILEAGVIKGAVMVFEPMTDLSSLNENLKQSNLMVQSLYERLGQVTGSKYSFDHVIGNNEAIRLVVQKAKKAATCDSSVILLGERGTGKEIFAHAIHNASLRREKPFIKVNCAEIPESMLENELFGYEKEAFTGSTKGKMGKLELANEGTLFIEEIGEMNLYLQAKLLKALEEMEFERVGGSKPIKVNVRVITSTNREIKELIRKGVFREDLYYRLNLTEIELPPLRTRKDDISLLVSFMIVKLNRQLGKRVKGITKSAERVLLSYDWPGNIRELENVVERAMVNTDEDVITHKQLSQYIDRYEATINEPLNDIMPFHEMEQILLKQALSRFGDSVDGKKKAARTLNISLATLYNKLKKYQLG